jgi:prepilin-type N-terminal cleavage/methylation domain-containing protein/prepilin-type processing-associated H-X9-DG protein
MRKCGNAEMRKCGNAGKGKSKRRSFTLLEVVFTIVIIGILLAIFLPAMSAIKLSAQKMQDVSNLKKIAEAWCECVINRGWEIDESHHKDFIEQLAGFGKSSPADMVLNDPYVYISPGDKHASKVTKEAICRFEEGVVVSNEPWLSAPSNSNFRWGTLISYCLILNLPSNVPTATTPLAFTRGLSWDGTGTWDERLGVYGSKGGYVLYCDGHVVWFDGSRPAKFLKWDQSGYTSDIFEAVPPNSKIFCSDWGSYQGESTKAILVT